MARFGIAPIDAMIRGPRRFVIANNLEQYQRLRSELGNSGKTGGKTPNGNRPAQIDINNFNGMPETSILQA